MNETWTSGDGRRFEIIRRIVEQGQHWIYYRRKDQPDMIYHCLVEAFEHRFTRELT